MATLSLTTHFTVDIDDDDSHTITGGSTTATDSISITHYFDKRYAITHEDSSGATEIWNDTMLADFDFLWIESDQAVKIQLLCHQDGTGENSFVLELKAGIPFCLASDFSRNSGSSGAIDSWEGSNWNDDEIDRVECYNTSGSTANVRVFAAT